MKVWSLIEKGKEPGQVLLQFDDLAEVNHFSSFLKDFLKQNPKRKKVRQWIKEMRRNLPVD